LHIESQEKDEASYLKSMDSFIDGLSEKYRDSQNNSLVRSRSLLTDLIIVLFGYNPH
jgi:hypothetical protein